MDTATYYHPEKLIPINLLICSLQDELGPLLESKLKMNATSTSSDIFENFISFLEYCKDTLLKNKSPRYHSILWTFVLNTIVSDFNFMISKRGVDLNKQGVARMDKIKRLSLHLFKHYLSNLNLGYVGSIHYNKEHGFESAEVSREPKSCGSNDLVLKRCFLLFRNVLLLANNMFNNMRLCNEYSQLLIDVVENFQFLDNASYSFTPIISIIEKNIYILSTKEISISDQLQSYCTSIDKRVDFNNLSFQFYEKFPCDNINTNSDEYIENEKMRVQSFYDDLICFYYYRSLNTLYANSDSYSNFIKLIKILAIDKDLNIAQTKPRQHSSQRRLLHEMKSKNDNEHGYKILPKIESIYFKKYSKRIELSKSFLIVNGLIKDSSFCSTNNNDNNDLKRPYCNLASSDISKLLDVMRDQHFIFDGDLIFNFIICTYHTFSNDWSYLEKNYMSAMASSGFSKSQFNKVLSNVNSKLENYKSIQDIFSEYLFCAGSVLQFHKKNENDDLQINIINSVKTRDILAYCGSISQYNAHDQYNAKLYRFLSFDFFKSFFVNFIKFRFSNGFKKVSLSLIIQVIDNPNLQIEDILVLDDVDGIHQSDRNCIWRLIELACVGASDKHTLLANFLCSIIQNGKPNWTFDGELLNLSDSTTSNTIFSENIASYCNKILEWNSEIEYINSV